MFGVKKLYQETPIGVKASNQWGLMGAFAGHKMCQQRNMQDSLTRDHRT